MFFDKLKKLLEGGIAQVNPFDNGKTFSTVMQNRQPAPAPRPQQKPNIIQDLTRSAQQGVQNQVRAVNNITRPVTGVSVSEITKQIPTAWGQVGKGLYGVGENVVKGAYDVGNRSVQTLDAPLKSIQIRNDISTGKISRDEGNRRLDNEFNQGFMSRDVAEGRAGVGEFGRQFTNAGLTIAPYAAPYMKGTTAAGRAAMPFKQALKPILQEGLGYSGLEVARQAANNEQITPSSVLNAGLTNVLGEFGAQGLAKAGANAVSEPLTRKGRELLERGAQAGQQFVDNMPARTQGGFIDPEAIRRDAVGKFSTRQNAGKIDMTPEDQNTLINWLDSTNSNRQLSNEEFDALENEVKRIADYYKIDGYDAKNSNTFVKNVGDVLDNRVMSRYIPAPEKPPGPLLTPYNKIEVPIPQEKGNIVQELYRKFKDNLPERTQGGYVRLPGSDEAAQFAGKNPKDLENAVLSASNADKLDGAERKFYDYVQGELKGGKTFDEIYTNISKNGVPDPVSAPVAANALEPAPEVNTKQSGFARSVSKSDEVSPELQAQVKQAAPEYTPVTNQAQIDASEALIRKGYKKAATEVNERLNVKEGTIDNQTTSDAIAAIKALDAKGGPANLQLATDLTEKLAAHLTKAGQTVQAASILNNRTPQGMLYAARKTLKKAGVEVTPEIQAGLDAAVKKVKATTGEEKQYAIAELTKMVNELIPSSFKDKAVTLWKAGLLTGIKTQTGNTLSGGASFAMKKASDPLAAGIDKLISLKTGKRTKTLTFKGVGSGAGEGMVKGWDSLKTGIDERNIEANKFDLKQVNFGPSKAGQAAQKYVNTVFGVMGAADRPLYYATLRNNLQDIAKAEAINNGLKGGKRAAFIADFVKNPPTEKFQTATDAAEKAIFGNDTVLSRAAAGLRQSVAGNPVSSAAVDVILPFTKVPSAVVSRIIDYSPVGAVKTAVLAIKNAKKTGVLDQRALSEGLAEAGVGTGVIAIGMALRESGLLTGSYPEDKKERELWKLEGKQENSIKVGGSWLSLNYTSPLGQLLGVGGKIADAKKEGSSTPEALAVGAAGGASTVLDQSFLQGVQGALDTVSNPVEEVPKFLNRQAGSLIPTLVGDTAKATDPLQREADNPLEAMLARVPGASQKLNPKRDAFGDPLARQNDPVRAMIDPFRSSDIKPSTPLNSELRRLQDAGEGIIPLRDSSYLGDEKKLSKAELNKIGSEVGPKIKSAWEKIIADPRYAKLSDADKNTTLRKAMTDINAAYKVMNSGSEEAYKNLTTDQKRVYSGKDASAFKDEPANAKERYESKLEKYNEDKEAGKITEIEDIKRKRELKGLEIRKDYSEDAIDLHSMSKKDVYGFISQSQNGQKLAEELLKLDDALTAAGVQEKNKFRDKYGNPTIKPKEKGSGGKKGKKAKLPTDFTKTRKAVSNKIRSKSTQITYKGTGKGSSVAIRKNLKKAKI